MSAFVPISALHSSSPPLRFVITGAGRGLGRGLSRLLISSGHDVFLLDNDAEELEHTLTSNLPKSVNASQVAKAGRYAGTTCDVSDRRSVINAMKAAQGHHREGKIDVLINNAARTGPYWESVDSLASLPLETGGEAEEDRVLQEWKSYVDTNLTGAFLVTKTFLPMLEVTSRKEDQESRPTVISISSTRAKQSEPNHEAYASTKAGLLGLTHALASSLQPLGIRSNAILPGWIPSAHESKKGDEQGDTWTTGLTHEDNEQHWSGRVGRIEDLYNAVLFLATTRFANGEEIVLDGGMTKKMQYVE